MSANLPHESIQRALASLAELPTMDDGPFYIRLHTRPLVPDDSAWQVLGAVSGPQPWARHERERTPLELVIEREVSITVQLNSYPFARANGFADDATSSADTLPCGSSGGRWSDLMDQIDDLIEESP